LLTHTCISVTILHIFIEREFEIYTRIENKTPLNSLEKVVPILQDCINLIQEEIASELDPSIPI